MRTGILVCLILSSMMGNCLQDLLMQLPLQLQLLQRGSWLARPHHLQLHQHLLGAQAPQARL